MTTTKTIANKIALAMHSFSPDPWVTEVSHTLASNGVGSLGERREKGNWTHPGTMSAITCLDSLTLCRWASAGRLA